MTNQDKIKAVDEALAYNERDKNDCQYCMPYLDAENTKKAFESLIIFGTIHEALTFYRRALVAVNKQANDDGLWFKAKYLTENYLQNALRDLHEIVEGKTREQCVEEYIKQLGLGGEDDGR